MLRHMYDEDWDFGHWNTSSTDYNQDGKFKRNQGIRLDREKGTISERMGRIQ